MVFHKLPLEGGIDQCSIDDRRFRSGFCNSGKAPPLKPDCCILGFFIIIISVCLASLPRRRCKWSPCYLNVGVLKLFSTISLWKFIAAFLTFVCWESQWENIISLTIRRGWSGYCFLTVLQDFISPFCLQGFRKPLNFSRPSSHYRPQWIYGLVLQNNPFVFLSLLS